MFSSGRFSFGQGGIFGSGPLLKIEWGGIEGKNPQGIEPIGEFCYSCERYDYCDLLPEECGIMKLFPCPFCGKDIFNLKIRVGFGWVPQRRAIADSTVDSPKEKRLIGDNR